MITAPAVREVISFFRTQGNAMHNNVRRLATVDALMFDSVSFVLVLPVATFLVVANLFPQEGPRGNRDALDAMR